MVRTGRSLVAVVVGYAVFVGGAWFAQEFVLGGVSFSDSLPKLVLAGILTPAAAVAGGFVTAALAGTRPLLHVVPMCVLIAVETTVLYSAGRVDGPLWFEAGAGASLIVGAFAGAFLWQRTLSRIRMPANGPS